LYIHAYIQFTYNNCKLVELYVTAQLFRCVDQRCRLERTLTSPRQRFYTLTSILPSLRLQGRWPHDVIALFRAPVYTTLAREWLHCQVPFYTVSTKKQSHRIFSIISVSTGEMLLNLEDLFLSKLRTQMHLHFHRGIYFYLRRNNDVLHT